MTFWTWMFSLAALAVLAGCQRPAPPAGPATTLPLRGGYRDAGDACRRVGEDAYANPFLDDAADLVACPAGVADLSGLGAESGAREVAVKDGWVLFSVRRR